MALVIIIDKGALSCTRGAKRSKLLPGSGQMKRTGADGDLFSAFSSLFFARQPAAIEPMAA